MKKFEYSIKIKSISEVNKNLQFSIFIFVLFVIKSKNLFEFCG